MAKYSVTHSCGHEEVVRLCGPGRERERRLAWLESTLCPECYKADQERKREEARRVAQVAAIEQELPELVGTEKQKAWAVTIRQTILDQMDQCIESRRKRVDALPEDQRRMFERVVSFIRENPSASWWIDHRDNPIDHLLDVLAREFKRRDEADAVVEKCIDTTIQPETPQTSIVASISIVGQSIYVDFPEKMEDFRLLMRTLEYTWTGRWARTVGPRTGPAADRAAETGHRLLAAGFPVRICDDAVREMITNVSYRRAPTRWISAKDRAFHVWWDRKHDFYAPAKRLPGARWSSPHMVVPMEAYEELRDFAERHEFTLSEDAERLAGAAERIKLESLHLATPAIPAETPVKVGGVPPKLEVPGTVAIAQDLRDVGDN